MFVISGWRQDNGLGFSCCDIVQSSDNLVKSTMMAGLRVVNWASTWGSWGGWEKSLEVDWTSWASRDIVGKRTGREARRSVAGL